MSKYTNYFVVKCSSEQEVQRKLDIAKIRSVVDADKTDYWFSTNYVRNGTYNWVAVSAPANSGFENGLFFYSDQFDKIGAIFETFLHFFQEEDLTNWNIKVKVENSIILKHFTTDKETVFSNNEKVLFSKCFDKVFTDFEPFLQAGKSSDFLNFVGIPYMEIHDQDKLPIQMFGDKYSLLADEVID